MVCNPLNQEFRYIIHDAPVISSRPIDGLIERQHSDKSTLKLRFLELADIDQLPSHASIEAQLFPPLDTFSERLYGETWQRTEHLLLCRYSTGGLIDIGWKHQLENGLESLDRLLLTHVLGNLVAIGLRLLGNTVLHGNAANIAGRAVAWLGDSGAGKSTLSAALFDAGHQLITDDQIVLSSKNGWRPAHGVPRVRLAPWSIDKMGLRVKQHFHQPETPNSKGWLGIRERQVDPSPPLSAIYVLGPRLESENQPRLTPVESVGERLHQLLLHRFGRRTLPLSELQYACEFKSLASLANDVSMYMLQLPDQLSLANNAVRALERHKP